jgi:hypothetical protein
MRQSRSQASAEPPIAVTPKLVVLTAAALAGIMGLYLGLDGDKLLGTTLVLFGAGFGAAWFALEAIRGVR